MDDLSYALTRLETARQYDDLIPEEGEGEYPEENEREKFNNILDDIKRAIKYEQQSQLEALEEIQSLQETAGEIGDELNALVGEEDD